MVITKKREEQELEFCINVLSEVVQALNNKQRREILRQCYEKPRTISELKRILKSSNKVTYENVKILEKTHFVKLEKRNNEKHHPVYVRSPMNPVNALLSLSSLIEISLEKAHSDQK